MDSQELREAEAVDLTQIEPHPMNAKTHNLEEIQSSLQEFGQTKALVVSRRTGRILAGNGTYRAMRMLGWTRAMVTYVDDLSDADELRLLAIDNKSGDAKNDPYRLHLLLEEIRKDQQGLIGTGYSDRFADRLAEAQKSSTDRTAALFAAAGIDPMKPATFKIPCTQGQAEQMLDWLQRYADEHEMKPGEALHEIMAEALGHTI